MVVMAMSGKQLENQGVVHFCGTLPPARQAWKGCGCSSRTSSLPATGTKCGRCGRASALLVDEAHDLKEFAAKAISDGHKERAFYLVLACDRHQKLRLSNKDDTRIIKGLDFTLKSKRLRQIYRNPIPIYIVSLALMFRWGAKTAPRSCRRGANSGGLRF